MNGLTLSRKYFEEIGRPALEQQFPDLFPHMAIGLAGEGSECFGFDDEWSQDHDWGPAFCIWLSDLDYKRFGGQVQRAYWNLAEEFDGFPIRKEERYSTGRIGCLNREEWYQRYTGRADGPQTLDQWRRTPEAFLATATNGEIFHDPDGQFSAVRNRLRQFYPEDVRVKKIAARIAVMAQAGQYNYPRCIRRGDCVAAQFALTEFMKAAMSAVYLLNRKYAPFYKWMHRGMQNLSKLTRVRDLLEQLIQAHLQEGCELIERICLLVAGELRRQRLSDSSDPFLQNHCEMVMLRIRDPKLRQAHIMEE